MITDYLENAKKQFLYYKILGEKAMEQVPEEKLFWQYEPGSNSIAIIVQHLAGNMLSRWTDLFTSDGEKEWRDRNAEFENELQTKDALLARWNQGWNCFFNTIDSLNTQDLEKEIFIRNMSHSVADAINRQLAHYPYHIGQIVLIAKMTCGNKWTSLSIPRGNSKTYNADKFAKPKNDAHFTDELLKAEKAGGSS